jgi:hypothetical protein
MSAKASQVLLWPFTVLWNLLTFILGLVGRVVAAVLGVVLMAVGIALTMTIAGAPIGIPVAVLGLLLLIRSVF